MRRVLGFLYGVLAYALFFVTFLYAIGFVTGLVVPRTVDAVPDGSAGGAAALGLDMLLLTLFAVQHSGMARRGFKRWWTRVVPRPIERSTYVILSSAALLVLFAYWRPLPGTVWDVRQPAAAAALWTLAALGWGMVFVSTFLLGHFHLFGLAQVWANLKRRALPPDRFRTPLFYRVVRHPLMLGFLIAFWATPHMSAGHLLFSIATTGYILLAVRLEERDLVHYLGDVYRVYRERVPAFLPMPGRVWRPGAGGLTPGGRAAAPPAGAAALDPSPETDR